MKWTLCHTKIDKCGRYRVVVHPPQNKWQQRYKNLKLGSQRVECIDNNIKVSCMASWSKSFLFSMSALISRICGFLRNARYDAWFCSPPSMYTLSEVPGSSPDLGGYQPVKGLTTTPVGTTPPQATRAVTVLMKLYFTVQRLVWFANSFVITSYLQYYNSVLTSLLHER